MSRDLKNSNVSLSEVHASVAVPQHGHWWRRLLAFVGPSYMVAVGYMDPGNWATDLAAGSQFGYRLLWILVMSNIMAILLQTLSARLGLVTGRDLAQACRDSYGPVPRWVLYALCEVAIAACDLAEVLGTAIGINLLFPSIPLFYAVLITGLDSFLLLVIQRWGIRKMEAFILMLITTIGVCFLMELFLVKPSLAGVASGVIPTPFRPGELFVAIGIIGATVMPHNLYLHSALVQSRQVPRTLDGIRHGTLYNLIDAVIALNGALFVNAAILIVAAAAFGARHIQIEGIQDAYRLLENLLGHRVAPVAFAIALIAAGQSSTLTGTIAGQITMEGFIEMKLRPWVRRIITRSLALIPALLVIGLAGEKQTENLLILSQVILSLQLPFAVVPLVKFTGSRRWMRDFVNPTWVQALAWVVTAIIIALNVMLVVSQVRDWGEALGQYRYLLYMATVPFSLALLAMLLWMAFKREKEPQIPDVLHARQIAETALQTPRHFKRIGVALEAIDSDSAALSEAITLARNYRAQLVLIHIVEGVGGQWYGKDANDTEQRHDEEYLKTLAHQLRERLGDAVAGVHHALGYGSNIPKELANIVRREHIDLVVTGGHGHHKLTDIFTGETIASLRHRLRIPVFAVRP